MQRSDFHYILPEELIAQEPAPERRASRLLCVDPRMGRFHDRMFSHLLDYLHSGDLLVMNDSRVFPARLLGNKESGGRVEVFVERILDSRRILAQARSSKPLRPGGRVVLESVMEMTVMERKGDMFILELPEGSLPVLQLLETYGRIPLPPYIEREADESDRERYQTVYANQPGSVAAPTAGLHFDNGLLEDMSDKGVQTHTLTLHVGAGTFQPMRSEKLSQHRMHSEVLEIDQSLVDAIRETRQQGGRVVAVGTTVVRALETAAQSGELRPFRGETEIFIYPGYSFRVVDALVTNFHLPESTLLMLVCAFGGQEMMLDAYRHAVEQRYRFFSYGDAMFIQGRDGE